MIWNSERMILGQKQGAKKLDPFWKLQTLNVFFSRQPRQPNSVIVFTSEGSISPNIREPFISKRKPSLHLFPSPTRTSQKTRIAMESCAAHETKGGKTITEIRLCITVGINDLMCGPSCSGKRDVLTPGLNLDEFLIALVKNKSQFLKSCPKATTNNPFFKDESDEKLLEVHHQLCVGRNCNLLKLYCNSLKL